MSIGGRIRDMRKAKGMSQKALAVAIGISAPSLSDLERGETKQGRGSTILAVAKILNCSPNWLQYGKGIPTASPSVKSIEAAELIAIYEVLSLAHQIVLLSNARALMDSQTMAPTSVNPFPTRFK